MARPDECVECGYEANEPCDVCGLTVCDDCIDMHGLLLHEDEDEEEDV